MLPSVELLYQLSGNNNPNGRSKSLFADSAFVLGLAEVAFVSMELLLS